MYIFISFLYSFIRFHSTGHHMKGEETSPKPVLWWAGGTHLSVLEGTHISSIDCPKYWDGKLRAAGTCPNHPQDQTQMEGASSTPIKGTDSFTP